MWRNVIKPLEQTISKHKWLTTVALFGFVLVKVVFIARGNIQTALGIFNSAGAATVVVGSILSALPLVSSLALGLAIFQLTRSFPLIRVFPRTINLLPQRLRVNLTSIEDRYWPSHAPVPCGLTTKLGQLSQERRGARAARAWIREVAAKDNATLLTLVIAAIICFFVAPSPIAIASASLGFISGALAKIKKGAARDILLFVAGLAWIFLVLYPFLYSVWLPHETLAVPGPVCPQQKHRTYVVGYVLSDGNGWISLLVTGQRLICRIRSEEVTARTLCQGQIVSMPGMGEWYKSGPPLEKAVFPRAATTLPPCSKLTVVCGTVLNDSPAGAVVYDATNRLPTIKRPAAGGLLLFRVARGCNEGTHVTWVPPSAAHLVKTAYAKDGQIAGVVLKPNGPHAEFRLIATRNNRIVASATVKLTS
jgi:hypothetical protein